LTLHFKKIPSSLSVNMSLIRKNIELISVLVVSLVLFVLTGFFTTYSSPTIDESTDMGIVNCLLSDGGFFDCTIDISQFRLIYIFPYLFLKLTGGDNLSSVCHVISALFTALTLPFLFYSVKKVSNSKYAWISMAVFCSHPSLLNAAVITLTHSMSVLLFFTTFSGYAFLKYQERASLGNFILLVTGLALTFSSSMVSIFIMPAFLVGILMVGFPPVRWLLIGLALAITIFFSFNFYLLSDQNWTMFLSEISHSGLYNYWNYLGTNEFLPPWYFGWVTLVVRFMPILTMLLLAALLVLPKKEPLVVMGITILCFSVVKVVFFQYEAPHHQWYYYPIFLILIFKWLHGLEPRWKNWTTAVIALSCVWGVYGCVRFYPNLLFYGAQYGDVMIGEFYGPAVTHAQDNVVVNNYLNSVDKEKSEVVLYQGGSTILKLEHPKVMFSDQKMESFPLYAISDRIALIMNTYKKQEYIKLLENYYDVVYQYDFPYEKWAYRVHKLKPDFRNFNTK
jgi:4-amino-4-deoxy-L-arabinose transferase-like glycosyltransferase